MRRRLKNGFFLWLSWLPHQYESVNTESVKVIIPVIIFFFHLWRVCIIKPNATSSQRTPIFYSIMQRLDKDKKTQNSLTENLEIYFLYKRVFTLYCLYFCVEIFIFNSLSSKNMNIILFRKDTYWMYNTLYSIGYSEQHNHFRLAPELALNMPNVVTSLNFKFRSNSWSAVIGRSTNGNRPS